MKSRYPYVTIIGRPNVGKSTFFNRVIRERKAIVEDQPGVTRDRLYAHAEWDGVGFGLIDTAGLTSVQDDQFSKHIAENGEIAMNEGDVIIFMTDGKAGLMPDDYVIADMLRKKKKHVLVVKNKSEKQVDFEYFHDLYALGFDTVMPVSAEHGTGFSDVMDKIIEMLPEKNEAETINEDEIRVAIVGRPNVGKSTLLNSLLGENRSVVSDVAGTTRDMIDAGLKRNGRDFRLVDTAGIRRKSKVEKDLEGLMVMRALKGIDNAHVVIMMIDGTEGFTEQDEKIASYAHERGTGVILAYNKWDAVEKDDKTYLEVEKKIRDQAGFLNYAPLIFISAQERKNLFKLMDLAAEVYDESGKEIGTSKLNRFLEDIIRHKSHPIRKRKIVKLKYMTQTGTNPPRFLIFTNFPELIHFSYERYIKNELRKMYGFKGSDIKLSFRKSSKNRYGG